MKTLERLSDVTQGLKLCDGVFIPLREGFFHSSKELGVYMDELDAHLPENPYSVFRALFKRLRNKSKISKAKDNCTDMQDEVLERMIGILDSVPELRNTTGKRWHVYNPVFVPLALFLEVTLRVSESFMLLTLDRTPEIRRMQMECGVLPIVWFEAWKKCLGSKLEFMPPEQDESPLEWRTLFVDRWYKSDGGDTNGAVAAAAEQVPEPVVLPAEPDSVTEAYLGSRRHNPVICDATLSYILDFGQSASVLSSVVDMLRIKDIDTIDDVKIGPNGTVELTLLTEVVNGYPIADSLQVDKLRRLSGIIDKVYTCIYQVLCAAERQSEALAPLVGATRTESTECNADNIH